MPSPKHADIKDVLHAIDDILLDADRFRIDLAVEQICESAAPGHECGDTTCEWCRETSIAVQTWYPGTTGGRIFLCPPAQYQRGLRALLAFLTLSGRAARYNNVNDFPDLYGEWVYTNESENT